VNGPLGTVRVADASVTTEAAIDVAAFGGTIRVSDVSLHGLFSPVPALTLDAVLSGIDLRKATEAIGVGYISGIVEGEVHDLEIAAGAPVRFDAHIETVPVEGVPERISVTAIDQLAVLGGGASGGALARSVMGLFREYRYAKLGFRCSLKNDRFVLQGVTTHEDEDFLVVGTFIPPTVNVVSHNREVAFKEMVERLQRVMALGRDEAARGADVAPATEPAADVAPATDNAKPPTPASEAAPVPPQQPSQAPSQDQRTGEPR